MKKTVAAFLFGLVSAWLSFPTLGQETSIYTGTKTASAFQQYCYTNGVLCVLRNAADQVVEPAEFVLRRDGVTNTYKIVRTPEGLSLTRWVLAVKTAQTVNSYPETNLDDLYPAATYTGETVSLVGAGVSEFTHWDSYLFLIPCFNWARYRLVYEKNDGTTTSIADSTVHSWTNTVSLATNEWSRTGYTFQGWSVMTTNGVVQLKERQLVTGKNLGVTTNGTYHLQARWSKIDLPVTLDANGGTVSTTRVTAHIDEPWDLPTPTRANCTFKGWFTHPTGGTQMVSGEKVTRTDITRLYARWELFSYEIKVGTSTPRLGEAVCSGANSSSVPTVYSASHGARLTLTAYPNDGSKFVQWDDGSVAPTRTVTVQSNAVYWAQFAAESYTVTFAYRTASGGTDERVQTVGYREQAWPPADEVCKRWAGHRFVRWDRSYDTVTSDLTVNAVYAEDKKTSTVYFLANGGVGEMEPQDFTEGTGAALRQNAFTLTNATFCGWATNAAASTNEVLYTDSQVVTDPAVNGALALYAVWAKEDVQDVDDTLTLVPDGWQYDSEESAWVDAYNSTNKLFTALETQVTGPGVLTYRWRSEGGTAETNEVCLMLMKDGQPVKEMVEASDWHTGSLRVTQATNESTVVAWQKTKGTTVWLSDMLWTSMAGGGTNETETVITNLTADLVQEGEYKDDENMKWHLRVVDEVEQWQAQGGVDEPFPLLTATVTGRGTLSFEWNSPENGLQEREACEMKTNGVSVAILESDGTTDDWQTVRLTIEGDGEEETSLSWERCQGVEVSIRNVVWTTETVVVPDEDTEPEDEAEPVSVDPTPTGWQQDDGVWQDTGAYTTAPYRVLSGSVTGSGTLTYEWMAQGAVTNSDVCVLRQNGVRTAELVGDGEWHARTLTITTNETAETTLAWQRVAEGQVWIRNVAWTPETEEPEAVPVVAYYHVTEGLAYDGSVKTGVVAIAGCTVANATATTAGEYTATVTLDEGAVWPYGRTEAQRAVTWSIEKGAYDMSGVRFTNETMLVDGTAKSLAVSGALPNGVSVTYTGNGQTQKGRYTVTASFAGDTENYEAIDDMTADLILVSPFGENGSCEPVEEDLPIGAVSAFDVEAVYDGRPHGLDEKAINTAFASLSPTAIMYADSDASSELAWSATPITLTDVGTTMVWYRVTMPVHGSFTHAAQITVTPRDIAQATIADIPNQTWEGKPIAPAVTVNDSVGTFDAVSTNNYTVSYANNAGVGTATVTVTGRGNYTGTLRATFAIVAPTPDPEDPDDPDDPDTPDDFVETRQLEPFTMAITNLGVPALGAQARVKAVGLPTGLRARKTTDGWVITGTPKETMDGVTRKAYVIVTENRVQTLYLLRLRVLPADTDWVDTVGTAVSRDLPDAASASGLPRGIRFKDGVCSGTPTKAGVYAVKVRTANRERTTFYWIIEAVSTPTCVVNLDAGRAQENDCTVLRQGIACSWPVTVSAGATVRASGLPSGLKLSRTADGYELSGTPKRAGNFVVTFKTKLGTVTTVTTEAFIVKSLPTWVIGTFNGGGVDGQVTLKVSNAGKISGKWLCKGATWKVAATGFDSYDAETDTYKISLKLTAGTSVQTKAAAIAEDDQGVGCLESELFEAQQNVWRMSDWKAVGRKIAGQTVFTYLKASAASSMTLKVSASGAVSIKGAFVLDDQTTYSATSSAVLCPQSAPEASGSFAASVYVYFPTKAGKFPTGYVARVDLRWNGSAFVVENLEETVSP